MNFGSLKATTNYSYDENGNLIKESNSYNMSYSAACKCMQAILYDGNGNRAYTLDRECDK
ncbi:MAG: hypothetical protein PUD72_02590 [Oscillospiraceae bacterium]|nr:hypothetical protein [Oscillospiraceae bacterium]